MLQLVVDKTPNKKKRKITIFRKQLKVSVWTVQGEGSPAGVRFPLESLGLCFVRASLLQRFWMGDQEAGRKENRKTLRSWPSNII